MNRLALAFGIVCLLQGLSAAPRPEYGLSVSIKNSGKITALGYAVSDIVDGIDGIVLATLSAGYDKYDSTLEVISSLIDDVSTVVDPIIDAYVDLVADTSGDVDNAFAPFLSAITDAMGYMMGNTVQGYKDTLTGNGYTSIADQIHDEGVRLYFGLLQLSGNIENIKGKVNAALTAAGSANVPTNILNDNLKLSDMYQFLMTANGLKAFLPLLGYILSTVNEHLQVGDDFITNLQAMIDDDTDTAVSDYQDELDEILADIEFAVADGMDEIYDAYSEIYDGFLTLDLSDATDISSLDTTLSSFVSAFEDSANIDALELSLEEAFDDITSALATLADELSASITAVDDALVQLLVDTLIGNLEYGEYCFYKYKDLLENLYTQGLEGGWECIDKEYIRLDHLWDTLLLILELLSFDFEDMEGQLNVCDMISENTDNLNGCVTELNEYYTALLDATESKRDLLYDLAEGEAEASKNRLLICFELVYIDTSVTQVAALNSGLTECASAGPNGTD